MKFSLVNVILKHDDGKISGFWIQNHVGTLESAKIVAKSIEAANSNRIEVAVVEEIPSSYPAIGKWSNLVPL